MICSHANILSVTSQSLGRESAASSLNLSSFITSGLKTPRATLTNYLHRLKLCLGIKNGLMWVFTGFIRGFQKASAGVTLFILFQPKF